MYTRIHYALSVCVCVCVYIHMYVIFTLIFKRYVDTRPATGAFLFNLKHEL